MCIPYFEICFARPYFFLLLAVIPVLIAFYWYYNNRNTPEIGVSGSDGFAGANKTFRQRIRHLPFVLRMLTVALIIIILARPQTSFDRSDFKVEGIDMLLAMDISGSMLAEDFKPNRLDASKEVAMNFIDGRPNDRIGLVIFSSEAFMQCPLTIDHTRLKSLFSSVKSGVIADGTAIGDGLGLSVYHIRKSEAISKVVILLTDGINNTGSMDPMTAAEIAKKFGVRVYTIGVGTKGMAPYPFQTNYGIQYQNIEVQIDEDLLRNIAQTTGGEYFRATDKQKLDEIYKQIDRLEKSKIDVTKFTKKKEEYLVFALLAAGFFLLEILLKLTVYKKIP
jgi:Ca-activated chloride channel family protein